MKGKLNRLSRIISPRTQRSLVVAVDHGMALGPLMGIIDIAKTLRELNDDADAWLMTKGILTYAYQPDGKTGIILRASGATTISGPDLTEEDLTSSVEEALFLGVDAVAVTAFIGSPHEHETLKNMARLAESCRRWDVPLVGVVGVGKNEEKMFDPRFLALGARVVAEHGADIVKTYYTPEGFDKVVAGCPIPVMIAGGPKCDTEVETLEMIFGALHDGAAGIVMGRNIWQSPNPSKLIKIVRAMIHENLGLKDARERLEEE